MRDTYRTVEALMVLHNICIDIGDAPESIIDFNPGNNDVTEIGREEDMGELGDDEAGIPEHETDAWLREAGRQMRDQIMDELIPEAD